MSEIITPRFETVRGRGIDAAVIAVWASVHRGDTCEAASNDKLRRVIQVEGDFAGITVVLEGSNDGENFHPLTDRIGVPIRLVKPGIAEATEATIWFRPLVYGDYKPPGAQRDTCLTCTVTCWRSP